MNIERGKIEDCRRQKVNKNLLPYRECPNQHYVDSRASYLTLSPHTSSLSIELPHQIVHLQEIGFCFRQYLFLSKTFSSGKLNRIESQFCFLSSGQSLGIWFTFSCYGWGLQGFEAKQSLAKPQALKRNCKLYKTMVLFFFLSRWLNSDEENVFFWRYLQE